MPDDQSSIGTGHPAPAYPGLLLTYTGSPFPDDIPGRYGAWNRPWRWCSISGRFPRPAKTKLSDSCPSPPKRNLIQLLTQGRRFQRMLCRNLLADFLITLYDLNSSHSHVIQLPPVLCAFTHMRSQLSPKILLVLMSVIYPFPQGCLKYAVSYPVSLWPKYGIQHSFREKSRAPSHTTELSLVPRLNLL